MSIKAVIFDLGGTLIRYTGPYEKWPDLETPGFMAAYNHLKQSGVEMPKFLEFRDAGFAMLPGRWQQATAGERNLRLVELLDDILRECRVEGVTAVQLKEAAESYQQAVRAQAQLVPAAVETLAQVRNQGYRIGLLSNTMFTGEAHLDDLDRFGLTPYFDAMLFSADVNKWKPGTAPFLQVLAELDVDAGHAVFIGDDPAVDVVGGHNAGLRTIHLKSGQRFADPDQVQPDAVIYHLTELFPILAAWADGASPAP